MLLVTERCVTHFGGIDDSGSKGPGFRRDDTEGNSNAGAHAYFPRFGLFRRAGFARVGFDKDFTGALC